MPTATARTRKNQSWEVESVMAQVYHTRAERGKTAYVCYSGTMKDADLKVGSWWVGAVPLLRRLGVFSLLAVAIFFAGTAVSGIAKYLRSEHGAEAMLVELTRNSVQYAAAEERIGPQELVTASAVLLPGGKGKGDVAAVVRNPSVHWAVVTATLTASVDGEELGTATVSFLPGEERFIAFAGVTSSRVSPQATITIRAGDVTWRRTTADALALPALTVDDVASTVLSTQPGTESTQVKGTLVNGSLTDMASVTLTAFLYTGTRITGLGVLTVTDLRGLEERDFDIRLTGAFVSSRVVVEPSFDLAPFVE